MDRRNIVLLGFMGTGKSVVGRMLAKQLGRSFADTDQQLEKREGRPIPKIFLEEGENRFREIEREVVAELAGREAQVIACGGGVVLDPVNLEILAVNGILFCLRASTETILARVGDDHNRPLLQGDAEANIRRLLEARESAYAGVTYQIDTDELNPRQVVAVIRSILDREG